jgi:hypothetical protein
MPRPPGGPTPSNPGNGYTLDWEDASDRDFATSKQLYGWRLQYWPDIKHAGDGEPQIRVARRPGEPVSNGQWSTRFHLEKTDRPHSGGSRAEFAASPFEPVGAERWYGFSIYLPNTWKPDVAPESVIQWHQASDTGGSPPLAIWTLNGRFLVVQAGRPGRPTMRTDAGSFVLGAWTYWVVHVKWSKQTNGILEVWKNGSRVQGITSPDITDSATNTTQGNYIKIGIYKWPWSTSGFTPPSVTTRRVMYHDQLRIADQRGSYAAVVPR